jgi:hypothetical protein
MVLVLYRERSGEEVTGARHCEGRGVFDTAAGRKPFWHGRAMGLNGGAGPNVHAQASAASASLWSAFRPLLTLT